MKWLARNWEKIILRFLEIVLINFSVSLPLQVSIYRQHWQSDAVRDRDHPHRYDTRSKAVYRETEHGFSSWPHFGLRHPAGILDGFQSKSVGECYLWWHGQVSLTHCSLDIGYCKSRFQSLTHYVQNCFSESNDMFTFSVISSHVEFESFLMTDKDLLSHAGLGDYVFS